METHKHLSKISMVMAIIFTGACIYAYMSLDVDNFSRLPLIFRNRILSFTSKSNSTDVVIELQQKQIPPFASNLNGTQTVSHTTAEEETEKEKGSSGNSQKILKDATAKSQGNKTVGQPELEVTTQVSFDPFVVVRCKTTPYLKCSSQKAPAITDRVFHFSMLRRPGWLKMDQKLVDNCEQSACRFDGDKVTEQTDVVILYSVGLKDQFSVPKRWPHQLYAAASWESPPHTRASFVSNGSSRFNYYHNLTISYRVDSDVFMPYRRLVFDPRPLDERPNYLQIAKEKTKMAAWLVSNCRTPSKRREYVTEMQKYIRVDIYGGCGTPCKDSYVEKMKTDYRFYLAFENSLCVDYVTEKFFKFYSQDTHIIQVSRGGADYDKYFPEKTFINSANFKNPKDLALYLKSLAEDPVEYSKLLEYKDLYRISSQSVSETACELCKYLHTQPRQEKIYDIKEWWADGKCHGPTDLD